MSIIMLPCLPACMSVLVLVCMCVSVYVKCLPVCLFDCLPIQLRFLCLSFSGPMSDCLSVCQYVLSANLSVCFCPSVSAITFYFIPILFLLTFLCLSLSFPISLTPQDIGLVRLIRATLLPTHRRKCAAPIHIHGSRIFTRWRTRVLIFHTEPSIGAIDWDFILGIVSHILIQFFLFITLHIYSRTGCTGQISGRRIFTHIAFLSSL